MTTLAASQEPTETSKLVNLDLETERARRSLELKKANAVVAQRRSQDKRLREELSKERTRFNDKRKAALLNAYNDRKQAHEKRKIKLKAETKDRKLKEEARAKEWVKKQREASAHKAKAKFRTLQRQAEFARKRKVEVIALWNEKKDSTFKAIQQRSTLKREYKLERDVRYNEAASKRLGAKEMFTLSRKKWREERLSKLNEVSINASRDEFRIKYSKFTADRKDALKANAEQHKSFKLQQKNNLVARQKIFHKEREAARRAFLIEQEMARKKRAEKRENKKKEWKRRKMLRMEATKNRPVDWLNQRVPESVLSVRAISSITPNEVEEENRAARERVDDETSRAQAAAKRGERFIDCTAGELASG